MKPLQIVVWNLDLLESSTCNDPGEILQSKLKWTFFELHLHLPLSCANIFVTTLSPCSFLSQFSVVVSYSMLGYWSSLIFLSMSTACSMYHRQWWCIFYSQFYCVNYTEPRHVITFRSELKCTCRKRHLHLPCNSITMQVLVVVLLGKLLNVKPHF